MVSVRLCTKRYRYSTSVNRWRVVKITESNEQLNRDKERKREASAATVEGDVRVNCRRRDYC